jgi:hypothetical protein
VAVSAKTNETAKRPSVILPLETKLKIIAELGR